MEKPYDVRHILMFELLNIITSSNYNMGFDTVNKIAKEYMTSNLIEERMIKFKNIYLKTLHVYSKKKKL